MFSSEGNSLKGLTLTEHGEMEIEMAEKLDPNNFEENVKQILNVY